MSIVGRGRFEHTLPAKGVRETAFAGGAMLPAIDVKIRHNLLICMVAQAFSPAFLLAFPPRKVFYVIEHPASCPVFRMTPAWAPAPTLLAYAIGTTLLAAGIGLTIPTALLAGFGSD